MADNLSSLTASTHNADQTKTVGTFASPRHAGLMLGVLVIIGLFTTIDVTLVAVLGESIKVSLELDDVQLSLLQGASYGLSFGLAAIPAGRLVDKHNRLRLLALALLVWGVATAGMALSRDFSGLIYCRIALGMGAAILIPAALSLISDIVPRHRRAAANSLFAVGQISGGGLAYLLSGWIMASLDLSHLGGRFIEFMPWQSVFFVFAFPCLILVPVLLVLKEPERREQNAGKARSGSAIQALWSYRHFIVPLLAGLTLVGAAEMGTRIWAAPALMRLYDQTPVDFAGWLGIMVLVTGLAATALGAGLAERGRIWRQGGILMPAIICSGLCAVTSFYAIAPSVASFGAILGANLSAGYIVVIVGVSAITLTVPNEYRGTTIGIYTFTNAIIGISIAPTAVAFASCALGGDEMLGWAIGAVGFPAALLGACCFYISMRAMQNSKSTELLS